MDAETVLQHVLALGEEELLRLRFATDNEANSMRLRLLRKKVALEATNPDIARRILIVYKRREKIVEVKIIPGAVVVERVSKNGSSVVITDDPEMERIAEMMRLDGRSDEEIKEFMEALDGDSDQRTS